MCEGDLVWADRHHACVSGGSSEAPDGLPLGWGDSTAAPARESQSGQSSRGHHHRRRSSVAPGGPPSLQQDLPFYEASNNWPDGGVEAERVQSGLSWAQQQVARSRQQHPQASPRHARRESSHAQQDYQQQHPHESNTGFDNGSDESPGSHATRLREQELPHGQSLGGVDTSMGGESLFIAAEGPPAQRQDSVSLQWHMPKQLPKQANQQVSQAATTPAAWNTLQLSFFAESHQQVDLDPHQSQLCSHASASAAHPVGELIEHLFSPTFTLAWPKQLQHPAADNRVAADQTTGGECAVHPSAFLEWGGGRSYKMSYVPCGSDIVQRLEQSQFALEESRSSLSCNGFECHGGGLHSELHSRAGFKNGSASIALASLHM